MMRPHPQDEMRQMVLDHIRAIATYWATLPGKTPRERTEGVAFSILSLLDGETAGFPKFTVAPDPHPDDEAYCRERGIDWWPAGVDLAGVLHEQFFAGE